MEEAQEVIANVVNDNMKRSFFGTLKEIKLRFKCWHTSKDDKRDSEIKFLENALQKWIMMEEMLSQNLWFLNNYSMPTREN